MLTNKRKMLRAVPGPQEARMSAVFCYSLLFLTPETSHSEARTLSLMLFSLTFRGRLGASATDWGLPGPFLGLC